MRYNLHTTADVESLRRILARQRSGPARVHILGELGVVRG
jgi:hypothetical protein